MQLAGGLLSGNFGQGAAAYGATMAGAKDAALKRSLLQSQIDENASQNEARKRAGIKDARQQAWIESLMGGDQPSGGTAATSSTPASGGMAAPGGMASGGMPQEGQAPASPAAGGRVGLLELARQYGIPEQAIQSDMAFNGGKGISELLAKHGARDMQVTNGYAYDKNKVGAGFMPSLSTSTNGQTSMTRIGPDGMPVVSAPRGALETSGAYALQGARVGSMGKVNMRKNADGTESPVPESSENPALFPAPGGSVAQSRTGNPMIDAVMQTESGGNPNAVSPAGARGLMQVMPGTNTSPGFGVTPARDGSEGERTRVGQDYLGAMQAKYKDPALAAIAYNWGPGNTDMWLKSGGDFKKLPAETQSYVAQVLTRNGVNGQAATQPGAVSAAPRYGMTNDQQLAKDAGGKLNESWLKTSYEPVVASIGPTNDMLASVKVARSAIDKMGGTGWGTETKAMAANVLAGLGLASGNAKMLASNAQVFQTAAMDRLQSVLNEAKGPQTEGDSTRAQKTFANMGNTTEANKFILDLAEGKAQRDQMKVAFYQQALPIAQKKGDLQEVDREWAKRAPSIFNMPSMNAWGMK